MLSKKGPPPGMKDSPDSKVHGTNMGPIWGRQDPGGPHVGPMNLAIRDSDSKEEKEVVLP